MSTSEQISRRRKARVASNRCADCGKRPPRPGKVSCQVCTSKQSKYRSGLHKELRRVRRASGVCAQCGKPPLPGLSKCGKCTGYIKKAVKSRRLRHKKAALDALGGKCSCPGCTIKEIMFLDIDHIKGGGVAHRAAIRINIYDWLRKRDYKCVGLRLLCANCNQGRQRNGGVCPRYGRRH